MQAIVDRSGQYPPRANWLVVRAEVELLRLDFSEDSRIWVAGPEIAAWASRLFRNRDIPFEELESPEEVFRGFGIAYGEMGGQLQCDCLKVLANCEGLGEGLCLLLSELTGLPLFLHQPSPEHLKVWLLTEGIDNARLGPLLRFQVEKWAAIAQGLGAEELATLYRSSFIDRESVLRRWLGISLAEDWPGGLPIFPGSIPDRCKAEWRQEWGKRVRVTRGEVLRRIIDSPHIGRRILEELADVSLEYFEFNPELLTPAIHTWLRRVIPVGQMPRLAHIEQIKPAEPFNFGGRSDQVIEWGRRYIGCKSQSLARGEGVAATHDQDAAFGLWLIERYPQLMAIPALDSPFILSIAHYVRRWLANGPLLWVIVDGLNLPNFEYLIRFLSKSEEQPLTPNEVGFKFALLPTITEINKLALLTGKRPSEVWQAAERDLDRVIRETWGDAFYATSSEDVDELKERIRNRAHALYVWNFTRLDQLLHKCTVRFDLENESKSILDNLGRRIGDLLSVAAHDFGIRVVVSSDHGQVIGGACKTSLPEKTGTCQGRALVGVAWKDPSQLYEYDEASGAAYLSKDTFFLPDHVAVMVKSGCWGAWTFDTAGRAHGVHGGSSPDEVIVGFGLLDRTSTVREPAVEVSGRAYAGEPGVLRIRIDNPMRMSIEFLVLRIIAGDLSRDIEIRRAVRPNSVFEYESELTPWPSPPHGSEQVEIRWVLDYSLPGDVLQRTEGRSSIISVALYSATGLSLEEFNV